MAERQESTSSMKTETKMVDQECQKNKNTSTSLFDLFDSRLENTGLLFDVQPPKCQCCNHKRRIASLVCIDCGNLLLCKECSRTVHNNSSQSRTDHQLQDLSSFSPEKKIQTNCITKTLSPDLIHFSDGSEIKSNHISCNEMDLEELSKVAHEAKSILLIDGHEKLQVQSAEEFVTRLGCDPNVRCKVVSIFGNTGDGKSHTLNHTFFDGKDVFDTSASQKSCTVGVWAAFDNDHMAMIIDTEGLLGISENANKRMRLLLKILAISDVVLYRTRAERLHSDMFTFLGDASEAYLKYFSKDLKSVQERCKIDVSLCSLGPAVIVFQETHYTQPLNEVELQPTNGMLVKSPEDILRENFGNVGRDPQAFSSISYIGTRTEKTPTDFSSLLKAVEAHLNNSSVRSARSVAVIYNAIMVLNDKFAGDLDDMIPSSFPDAYFTCSAKCQSCNVRCECSMNHERDGISHSNSSRCKYQAQFDNRVFTCRICYEKGVESSVLPKTSSSGDSAWVGLAKYAWAGYVLECPECGVIYRSRQFWYGNREPVEMAVRTEIRHAWPGTRLVQSNENAARRMLDGMNSLAEKLGTVSAKPTKVVSNWVTDKVAPSYWVPNYLILECFHCGKDFDDFDKKHHCRACGQGFCDDCTTHRVPVPERGWGEEEVRVCNNCFERSGQTFLETNDEESIDMNDILEAIDDDPALETGTLVSVKTNMIPTQLSQETITKRKVTETVHSTLSYITSTLEYPREFMVDAARPSYWVPDSQIICCISCSTRFKPSQSKHHCRACGHGVCGQCSEARLPVPSRGWDYPVRICKECAQKKGPL